MAINLCLNKHFIPAIQMQDDSTKTNSLSSVDKCTQYLLTVDYNIIFDSVFT